MKPHDTPNRRKGCDLVSRGVRFTPQALRFIEAIARRNGQSFSAAARGVIEAGMSAMGKAA